ncbi:MAG: hypothetical protein IJI57_14385 [Flexilinea sp.]|nr:hypothetical protein [Flexilinea sp.]
MNALNKDSNQKKQETLMLVVFALLLAIIILVSKFVIGINFSLMEQGGYLSIGYHEVHGAQIWALEFESFTGSISSDGALPEENERKLMIHSASGNSQLTLKVNCGREEAEYALEGGPLTIQIPGENNEFTMTLSGTDVYTGYFNAVWE